MIFLKENRFKSVFKAILIKWGHQVINLSTNCKKNEFFIYIFFFDGH